MKEKILGLEVDFISRSEAVSLVMSWINHPFEKTKVIATVYGEFLVLARKDKEFRQALKSADLVTPDGVSILAAREYQTQSRNMSILGRLVSGLGVGKRVLQGSLGETITGVYFFEELARLGGERHWRVFLLGGKDGVAERTSQKLQEKFPGLLVKFDSGEKRLGAKIEDNERILKRINNFKPDVLCVAYDRVGQYKWLAANKKTLKAKVAIGLGGTFDEFLGDFKKAPDFMERMGLKWLWRLIQDPKRFGRIWRGVVVFPWRVFREILIQK